MYSRRREAPLGLLSWGSNPYPYAPDGSDSALRGTGGGGANLESGLDNGPVMEGVPFNVSGLYLQDEYDAGYTGERNLVPADRRRLEGSNKRYALGQACT